MPDIMMRRRLLSHHIGWYGKAFLLLGFGLAISTPTPSYGEGKCQLAIKDKQWAINRGIHPSRLDLPVNPAGRYWDIDSNQFIYQWMGSTLPASKVRIAKNPEACFALTTWSEDAVTSKQDIPIGTELIEGQDGQMRGRTPEGRIINIQLDDYDSWWLNKSDQEQSQWLDIYHSAVESGQLGRGVTFIQFMKVVMSKRMTLQDFKE